MIGLGFPRLCLAEEAQEDTGCNRGTDHTGNVRSHGVHEKVVLRVDFTTYGLGYTCTVRHCRDAGVTDERVDFPAFLEEKVEELYEEDSAAGRDYE